MRVFIHAMGSALLLACAVGQAVGSQQEIERQKKFYRQWWGTDLVLKFDELPSKGSVPENRMPYSGCIYSDGAGGTTYIMRKYDLAFNDRRLRATGYEQWDTTSMTEPTEVPERVGLFGLRTRMTMVQRTPNWYGHCNGWTAATIRHAEPKKSVVRNGITFTPADIKGLLAELYMYSQYEELVGSDSLVDAAGLHVTLANWLGRQSHPIAMEAVPGREKWNFPIYAFESSSSKRGNRVDVETKIRYLYYSNGEYQQSPRYQRWKYCHYQLNLNNEGEIVGGSFYGDSSRIDLLWVPLYPGQGGKKGNERGNPYLDVNRVLAIWRDSVSDDTVDKWVNIDPKGASLTPAQDESRVVPATATEEVKPKPDAAAKSAASAKPSDAPATPAKPATSATPRRAADAEGSGASTATPAAR